MAVNEYMDLLIDKLIEELNISDKERKEKLLDRDSESFIKLGQFGDKGFKADEMLEIDFDNIKKLEEAYNNDDKEEVMRLLGDFDFEMLNYIGKMARKRKIADIAYRLCISNLGTDEKIVKEELGVVDLDYKKNEKTHSLKLINVKKDEK